MVTLTLYCQLPGAKRPSRVFQAPLSPNQAMGVLGEALNAWAAVSVAPRVVLESGNVARIVRIGEDRS